jgi:hypothetical protein
MARRRTTQPSWLGRTVLLTSNRLTPAGAGRLEGERRRPQPEVRIMSKWRLALAAFVAALWAGHVHAVSTETQLTPQKAKVSGLDFRVTARGQGPHQEVLVAVRPEAGREVSPFLEGRLAVYRGRKMVLSCPVEKVERGGELRYRFTVAGEDVGKVRFSLNEYAFVRRVDKQGAVKVEPMPAVNSYWFHLKDFVGGK